MQGFYFTSIERADRDEKFRQFMNVAMGRETLKYHEGFPGYRKTPLVRLHRLAEALGLKDIYIKDESYRFGLNAFKGMGGSYSIGKWIMKELALEGEMTYARLVDPKTKEALGERTFITTTEGNHGRGVAWAARILGQKAVITMPKGASQERLENLRREGAEAFIVPLGYDETVRWTRNTADEKGWVLVQDTVLEGYEEIPRWIMEGYATMVMEAIDQLEGEVPTHVFLQAGVGSMAGAVAGLIADYYKDNKPIITVVEPNKADCIYQTAKAKDGGLHFVQGELDTIMAGLACGEPNSIGWKVLAECADYAASCPDWVSAEGMRVLGNALGEDTKVISGESGAVTTGFLHAVMTRKYLEEFKKNLALDENSKVLCFSTEGDTDKESYRAIVWKGRFPGVEDEK